MSVSERWPEAGASLVEVSVCVCVCVRAIEKVLFKSVNVNERVIEQACVDYLQRLVE